MGYKLFIDDERTPATDGWVIVRSSNEALTYIQNNGWPEFISFDHDLGGDDTTMVFLRKLVDQVWNGDNLPPDYMVHSANPVGSKNIVSFMESWKKSLQ
jgi:hypothetical protein